MESSCHSGTVASNASTDAIHPAEDGRLSSARVALLAVCCAASVANVYYAQPLLDSIARDFGVSQAAVGGVITATQLGCALALLFVVPLGDLLNRKRLIAVQLVLLSAACIGVATAPTRGTLLAGMVAVGLLGTAMTQGLIACSAALAGAGERGRVVGAAQGGVVVGLLAARSLAGVVTDIAGWRAVYLVSGALAIAMLVVLSRLLPDRREPRARIGYAALLRSMVSLLRDERVLRVRGAIALLMFAAFSIFWSALVLPLSAPPHAMSHTQIGAFGLVGALGAAAAARAGRLA
ncbi:MFS transporter, partial [Burkholderia cenocepacia]